MTHNTIIFPRETYISGILAKEVLLIFVLSVTFAIISGYRLLGFGFDYWDYVSFYDEIGNPINWNYVRFEPGYVYVAWFTKWILGLSYQVFSTFLISLSLFIKFCLFRAYLKFWPLAILSYVLILYPIHEYTQIRIAVSLSIILLALHYSFRKNIILVILLSYLAFIFHYTSIIMIPFLIVALFHENNAIQKFVFISIPLLSALLYFYSDTLIDITAQYSVSANSYLKSTTYAMNSDTVNTFSVATVIPLLVLISSIFLGFHKNNYNIVFIYMTAVSLFVAISFLNFPVFSHRLREIFTVGLLFIAFNRNRTPQDWIPALFVATYGVASVYLGIRDKLVFDY